MAGTAQKKAAAEPVDTAPDLTGAHPLVGVAGVAGIAEVTGDLLTAEEHRAAVRKEYGQYVATAPITHGGALAYNTGDPVPAANVEAWGYERLGLVRRTEAVAGGAAEITDHTNDDPNG